MFGLFKSKQKELLTKDFIWKNEASKYSALMKHLKESEKAIVVYYFDDTKHIAEEFLNSASINYSTESNSFATKVWLMNAKSLLHKSNIENRIIFFAEHHPSFAVEKEIKQHMLNNLGSNEVVFYTSFEDKLMQVFGSERILQIMEKMGLKDDEAIQHTLISSSLEKAQQKIDEQIQFPSDARIRKDWFVLNLPNTDKL